MPEKIYKPAYIRAETASNEVDVDSPIEVTLSDESVDRQGDIVEGFTNLRAFVRNNPIVLWQHFRDSPIGKFTRVWKDGTRTRGRFLLAEDGTSDLVDTVRSLVRQGIVRAGSVGFKPGEMEPLDEDDPWGGLRLMKNELLEFSLVSVPANANALIGAKSLSPQQRAFLAETDETFELSAAVQLGIKPSRDSDTRPTDTSSKKRTTTMSLSKRIEEKQEQLLKYQEALKELTEGPEPETDDEAEQLTIEIDELTDKITKTQQTLDRLVKAENALATKTITTRESVRESRETGGGSDADPHSYRPKSDSGHPRISMRKERKPGHLAMSVLTYAFRGYTARMAPLDMVRVENNEDRDELEILLRAATNPADVPTAAWAGNLVRDTWSEFLDLLRDMSLYPLLPGFREQFDRFGSIKMPKNDGRGQLAGDFVAEGAPIPVKEGVIGITTLEPKKMAVISSYTREIANQSTPAVQSVIQQQILGDTAELLDVRLTDTGARTAIRPAGYRDPAETGAANINISTGKTVAQIIADSQGMIQRMMAARVSTTAVWLMNPINVVYLRNIQDAASGSFPFRAEVSAGSFMGYPLLQSQNIPVTEYYLQGNGAVAYGDAWAPLIEVSDQATLVMDDTAPEHIVEGGIATTMPTRSMFQMDAVAIKMTLGLDWRIVRQGGVQALTGVDYS